MQPARKLTRNNDGNHRCAGGKVVSLVGVSRACLRNQEHMERRTQEITLFFVTDIPSKKKKKKKRPLQNKRDLRILILSAPSFSLLSRPIFRSLFEVDCFSGPRLIGLSCQQRVPKEHVVSTNEDSRVELVLYPSF